MTTCLIYNPASVDSVIAAAFCQSRSMETIPAIQSGNLSVHDHYDTYLWIGVKPNLEIFNAFAGKCHIGFFTGGTKKGRFFRSQEEKMAQQFTIYRTWENSKDEIQKFAGTEGYPEDVAIPETLLSLVACDYSTAEEAGTSVTKYCDRSTVFSAFGLASYIEEFESLKLMEIERQEIIYANYVQAVQALEQDTRLFASPGKQLVTYEPTFVRDSKGYKEFLTKIKRTISSSAEYRSIVVDDKPRTMPIVNLPPEQSPFAARILAAVYPFGLIYDNRRNRTVYMPFSRVAGFNKTILAGLEKAVLNTQKTPQLYCQF